MVNQIETFKAGKISIHAFCMANGYDMLSDKETVSKVFDDVNALASQRFKEVAGYDYESVNIAKPKHFELFHDMTHEITVQKWKEIVEKNIEEKGYTKENLEKAAEIIQGVERNNPNYWQFFEMAYDSFKE